ncbi:MAG: glycosyltransferase family 4 protein [Myxococcota bacterium]
MRLLLVTEDFPPSIGGIQSYCIELAHRFVNSCDAFAVAAPMHRGAARYDDRLPFPVFRTTARTRVGMEAASTFAVPALCRQHGFDVVFHAQWNTAHAGLLARGLGLVDRVFVGVHGRELLINLLGRRWNPVHRRLLRSVLPRVDHFVPVSRYTAELLGQAGVDSRRVTVVNNGVDPQRFAPTDGSEWRRRRSLGSAPLLLTVCRLVRRKGVDTVLHALAQLIRADSEVRYVIGGTGPDESRLRRLARDLGLERHVIFAGHISDEELPTALSAADVFVMPARSRKPDVEGFGIVFLEANACETAVVGARAGGVPDAVEAGVTGELVPPDDPAALAEVLGRLLADPRYTRSLGRRGRQRILEHKTWDHRAQTILALFEAEGRR